jgi:16S rRNA (cytosine1407-C5)-methyltransferase
MVEIELPVQCREAFTNFENEKLNPSICKAKRIVPWEIGSEGFFVAKLRKVSETENQPANFARHKKTDFIVAGNNQIKKLLEVLCDYYGAEKEIFSSYKFLVKNGDIYFVDSGFEINNTESFVRAGSKLGLIDKKQFIQLHTLAAQTFGNIFTKNIIELNDLRELDIYLSGGTIKREMDSTGQKIVKWNGYIIGTASSSKEGLKSQFPRAYRTQEIILK